MRADASYLSVPGVGRFLNRRLIGSHSTFTSLTGATSSTTHLAVTQHHGQTGSTQNETSTTILSCLSESVAWGKTTDHPVPGDRAPATARSR